MFLFNFARKRVRLGDLWMGAFPSGLSLRKPKGAFDDRDKLSG